MLGRIRPRYAILLVTVLSALLQACDNTDKITMKVAGNQKTSHRVEIVLAEKKPVSLTQTVSGTLEAIIKIRLYNEESGRIVKQPFYEGDQVKQGDLLVQLDNALLKTDVQKAKASREQAKIDLSRLKKLHAKKIATEEEVANAKTILDLATAEETRQLTRLKRTSITAPIDGVITERLFEPGDLLPPQSHIHTIIDPSQIRLKTSLAERWIPLIKKDQSIDLRIDALGDTTFGARIDRIHPTINSDTHKGVIEIILDPVPKNAKAGQFARATVELTASDRLVIPVHAIHYEPEGAYLYRVIEKDGVTVVEKVYFEQGQQFGALSEALTEIKAGDRIVTRGYLSLRDGKTVEVVNAEQSHVDSISE